MQGARAIAEMLKKNSTLRVLELNNNSIEYAVRHFWLSIRQFLPFNSIHFDWEKQRAHIICSYILSISLLLSYLNWIQGFGSLAGALLENNAIRAIHLK